MMMARVERLLVLCLLCLSLLGGVFAAQQPTQQFNMIFLSPFYVGSMSQNVNYSYEVSVFPPDGVSEVKSAVLNFDMWINPTRTFFAWVDGVPCNNPSYLVSTTFASSGRGVPRFDCSNVINRSGVYNVTFRVQGGNVGSSTAWLDLTYMNNPLGTVQVFGTEYRSGDAGKTFLQLLDSQRMPVVNATCKVRGYNPDTTLWFDYSLMAAPVGNNSDGLYYYDFIAPSLEGVYMLAAYCVVPQLNQTIWFDDFESLGFAGGLGNWASDWWRSDTEVLVG
jgi:hypothetical protein